MRDFFYFYYWLKIEFFTENLMLIFDFPTLENQILASCQSNLDWWYAYIWVKNPLFDTYIWWAGDNTQI